MRIVLGGLLMLAFSQYIIKAAWVETNKRAKADKSSKAFASKKIFSKLRNAYEKR